MNFALLEDFFQLNHIHVQIVTIPHKILYLIFQQVKT